MHAGLPSVDAVIAADAYVLILMIYAYSKNMVKWRWVCKYQNDKCADIETISAYFGKWYALALLIYSFIMTSGEVHIWGLYLESPAQAVYGYDNILLRSEVHCKCKSTLKKKDGKD